MLAIAKNAQSHVVRRFRMRVGMSKKNLCVKRRRGKNFRSGLVSPNCAQGLRRGPLSPHPIMAAKTCLRIARCCLSPFSTMVILLETASTNSLYYLYEGVDGPMGGSLVCCSGSDGSSQETHADKTMHIFFPQGLCSAQSEKRDLRHLSGRDEV